jgi:hypothetical protein
LHIGVSVLVIGIKAGPDTIVIGIIDFVVVGIFPLAGAVGLAVVALENVLGLLCHRVEVGCCFRVETGCLDTLNLKGSRINFVFFARRERNNFLIKGVSDAWRSLSSPICLTAGEG